MRVKSEAKRSALLQAAREVFLAKGYEASTMADIARLAGGSKATLYSYFPSKEAMFNEIMDQHCSPRFAQAFENLNYQGDLRTALEAFALSLLQAQLAPEMQAILRGVIAESGRSPVGALFYERGPKRGMQRLAQFLAQQMQAGRLYQSDPWQMARHLLALSLSDYQSRALLGLLPRLDEEELAAHVHQAAALFLQLFASRA